MSKESFTEFSEQYIGRLSSALWTLQLGLKWERAPLRLAGRLLWRARGTRATVWLVGDGGAASLAAHMATDLQLAGVRALPLTDVAAITTIGNDQSFAQTFSAQLERVAEGGDILIAISTSGNSMNILNAIAYARTVGVRVIA